MRTEKQIYVDIDEEYAAARRQLASNREYQEHVLLAAEPGLSEWERMTHRNAAAFMVEAEFDMRKFMPQVRTVRRPVDRTTKTWRIGHAIGVGLGVLLTGAVAVALLIVLGAGIRVLLNL